MRNVQNFCREFRTEYLKITLMEIQQKYGIQYKALSAFENGRSTNIKHLNTYYLLCKTKADRNAFITGFDQAMDADKKEGNK